MAMMAMLFLSSCYPGDTVSYADLDLVTTVYDTKTNFQELSTFVMPDTIIQLKDTLNTGNNTNISRAYDNMILGRIKQNMLDNGFVVATDPENNPPDVILTISAMATTTTTVWYDYPYYWGWYGGWGWYYKSTGYYPYWYPYYPWGGATYISSYTTGTLLMSMNDLRNVDAQNDSIPVIWLGAINGLLGETNKADVVNRLQYNIDKAFEQSSYLKQN